MYLTETLIQLYLEWCIKMFCRNGLSLINPEDKYMRFVEFKIQCLVCQFWSSFFSTHIPSPFANVWLFIFFIHRRQTDWRIFRILLDQLHTNRWHSCGLTDIIKIIHVFPCSRYSVVTIVFDVLNLKVASFSVMWK